MGVNVGRGFGIVLTAAIVLAWQGCGDSRSEGDGDGAGGTGAAQSTGGSSGSAGASGAGGNAGTSGVGGSGGSGGTSGASGAGGASGAAGSGGAGGASGAGGKSGAGGTGGSSGAAGSAGAAGSGGAGGTGDGGAPCSAKGCTNCLHETAPAGEDDCYCPGCPSHPMSTEQCAANTEAFDDVCAKWLATALCPAFLCIEPPEVACVAGECVAVGNEQ